MFNALSKTPKVTLMIILVLVMTSIFVIFKKEPRLGLDLKGGTRLTLEAVPTADVPNITPQVMDGLHFVIEKRVNGLGIGEAIVQRAGDKRLIVEIPGISDPEEAKRMLGRVGKLEFKRQVDGQWVNTGVSGKDLAKAEIGSDPGGNWAIQFSLNNQGADKFGKVTAELAPAQQPLGIFFDEQLVSAPVVNEPILGGSGQITGNFTQEEAREMVDVLNAGALPVDIKGIEETTVGPLYGQTYLQQSLLAGAVGLGLVLLFMVAYYRSQGMVASIALLVYTLLTYTVFLLVGVTFTLAGIAGFILSIGMAVDANILIFERTKEELKAGRSFKKAVEAGFDRAFPSIFDSNTTTLITCALLWWLGTGSVKGFALTLAIGVAVSMFSAITVTRTFLSLVMGQSRPVTVPVLTAEESRYRQSV